MGKVTTTTAADGSGLQAGPDSPVMPAPAADCPSCDTAWQPTPLGRGHRGPSVERMNENHAKLCPSPEWAEHIQHEVLPYLTEHIDLGEQLLEIGPGPGAATE